MYLYIAADLRSAGSFESAHLAQTTERHHLEIVRPRLEPSSDTGAAAARPDVSGVVLELASGVPSEPQLRVAADSLRAGRRVWLYWPDEAAVECVDGERLDSWRRHRRVIGWLRRVAIPADRALTIWNRMPTGLRWIYRGEFPVRRSDIFVKLTLLTLRAQPTPLTSTAGTAVYLRTDYWNTGPDDDEMGRVAGALASAGSDVVCLTPRRDATLEQRGVRQVVIGPPRRTTGEDAIVLAPVDYLDVVRTACQTLRPAYLYDRLTAAQSVGAELSQTLGIPYVAEYRGTGAAVREALNGAPPFYPEIYDKAEELALRQATVVVVRTPALKDELVAKGIDASRIAVADAQTLAPVLAAHADAERRRTHAVSLATGDADKDHAQNQWNQNPVGSQHARESQPHTLEWFREVERHRYGAYAPWMPDVMEFASHAGHDVLEIGGGIGTDLAQFAAHRARVTDVDLAEGHLRLAEENFRLRGLEGRFVHHDAEQLPFDAETFDVVYSHGVLHHTPNTASVVGEIARVLRPGGRAIVMLYAERSLHYWRQLVWSLGVKDGALERISIGEIMSRSVERSANDARPLVKVYTSDRAAALFQGFAPVQIVQRQMVPGELPRPLRWARPWIESRWGWNLIIKADKPRGHVRN